MVAKTWTQERFDKEILPLIKAGWSDIEIGRSLNMSRQRVHILKQKFVKKISKGEKSI